MSHTPGEWEILWLSDGSCDIDGPNDELICTMPPIRTLAKEHVANARLIAQAPAMLDALTRVLKYFHTCEDEYSNERELLVLIEDIINKATGAQEANQ